MNSRFIQRLAAMALSALIAVPALCAAQDKDQKQPQGNENAPFKFTVGANVVLVPVVVTDKKGNHVSGLTVGDFELQQDGKAQQITGFEEITAEATRAQRPTLPPNVFTNQVIADHPKKLEIIALDLVNTPFTSLPQARKGLTDFLAKSADPDTLTAFVVLLSNGPRMIHNFTSDPAVLVAAVRKLQASPGMSDNRTMDQLGDTSDIDVEAAQIGAILSGAGFPDPNGPPSAAAARASIAAATAGVDASRASQQGLITLECFQQLAQYFASVPGRKSLIWASSGFNFSLGAMTGELTRGTTADDWQRTMRLLQDANIAVYPVDVTGLGVGGNATPSIGSLNLPLKNSAGDSGVAARSAGLDMVTAGRFSDPNDAKHSTMRTVADMTGGQPFYNANDLEDLFLRAQKDSGQYYMLAYSIKDTGKTGYRKLSVKVRRDGVQARSRNGFYFNNAVRDLDKTRQSDEAAAMTSVLNSTSLPINGQWQQIEPAGDKRKVHFALQIPSGVIDIDTEHENHLSVDFIIVADDASSGKEMARIAQPLDRKLPAPGVSQIQASGLSYVNTLTLPPGQYNVHVVVRDNLRGNIGSVMSPLRVD